MRGLGGLRRAADAQGSAVRHGVHLHHLHPRARRAARACSSRTGPQGLRDMNEKVYTAWFPQCCAPTLITRDMADDARLPATSTARSSEAARRHGRQLDLRRRDAATRTRNVIIETLTDYGATLRDRAALHARDRRHRRLARAAHRRRASAATRSRGSRRPPTTAATSRRARRARAASSPSATAGSPRAIGPDLRERGHAVRRARRDRRLRDRDQRHEPDRHPRDSTSSSAIDIARPC